MERQDLLPFVMQVSRQMVETRELQPLLTYAIDKALELVGGERGYIVLLQPDGSLDFRVMRDNQGKDLRKSSDHISQSVLNAVVQDGKAVVVRNALTDQRFHTAKSVLHLQLRSIMCMPLISKQRIIGAIYVENRSIEGRFKQEDATPLEIFANQAAVAIENAQLNENLAYANEDLRRLDEMKSKFIILVSHELRTPLTVIKGYTDIIKLKSNKSDPTMLTYVQRLEESVGRMNMTIQEIISVFRIASNQLVLQTAPVNLKQLITHVIEACSAAEESRSLQFMTVGLEQLPMMMGDGKVLDTAIRNIISNAIKYTPDGHKITVTAQLLSDEISLVIADEGIGIPEEELDRIFDLFHILAKLEHHSSSKYDFGGGGMGLGLPIAKGIIEAHGGRITIESPGYDPENFPGTTCTIYLPYQGEEPQ